MDRTDAAEAGVVVTAFAKPNPTGDKEIVTLECDACAAILRLLLPLEIGVLADAMRDFSARHDACVAVNDEEPSHV